jgi:hypothetical protein
LRFKDLGFESPPIKTTRNLALFLKLREKKKAVISVKNTMEPEINQDLRDEEWYDDVYYDSDEDLEEEPIGIGLPGQQKTKSGKESI